MPPRRAAFRLRRLALFATLACLVPATVRAAWLQARTEHFEMFSSASEAESRRILVSLEQFRANFLAALPLRTASEPRTTIVVFGRETEFRPYKPLYKGKPKPIAGYFMPGDEEVMIAMTTDTFADQDPTEIIYHEYVHLLFHARRLRLPVWLNEGLAEVYSTFRVSGDQVEFGVAKDHHVAVLNDAAIIPLRRLFAVTHESPDYNEESRAGIFYAQSWALTHFFMCGADRTQKAKLGRYFELLAGPNSDPERSFREAFGIDYSQMESKLRNYLSGGSYFQGRAPVLLPDLDKKLKFQPADPAAAEFALLNLRWRMHHGEDTAIRALTLLDQYPDFPRWHELLATLAAADGDELRALEHWQKAAERKSDNPFAYLQLARSRLQAFSLSSYLEAPLPNDLSATVRAWLDRAFELSPLNPDVIESLALTEALSSQSRVPVVNRLQGAALKMPKPSKAFLALAIIRWRHDDAKTAAEIIDLVLGDRDADMKTRSAANLLRARLPDSATADLDEATRVRAEAFKAPGVLGGAKPPTLASTYLDRLLTERGSTAPRLVLPAAVVTAARTSAPDPLHAAIEAARLRAAEGDAAAMHEISLAYALGRGAEFSPEIATDWVEKAATAGNVASIDVSRRAQGDATLTCRFLRALASEAGATPAPPLDPELAEQITSLRQATPQQKLTPLHRPPPYFPEKLRLAGHSGNVVLRYYVDETGHVREIKTVDVSHPEFGEAAEQVVRSWRFLPAIRDSTPVVSAVETTFSFRMIATP